MKTRKQVKVLLIVLIGIFIPYPQKAHSQNYVPMKDDTKMAVKPKIEIKAYSFHLKQIRLLDSPFKTAMNADRKWLMETLNPDRFLHRFHANAGLPTKGTIYGGWENTDQSGFSFGHYISALSMLYATTGEEDIKIRLDYCISELKRCQDKRGTGYVGAIPNEDKLWDDVSKGIIDGRNFNLNNVWVPWYNLHKLWSGLIDAYIFGENETAKTIVIALTDWACDKFKDLTEEQWQNILTCEHGGMNDALYNVYAITGDTRHLEIANKFYHKKVLDPLSKRKNELAGLHANTQIPKVIGTSRSYELTGNQDHHTISSYFWHTVTHEHSYCIGGNSNYEHFVEPGKLSGELSNKTTETCNTYNMLKLTRHLFAWNPSAELMDFYERALYNHILASQNPETGMVCYCVPLAANSQKNYCNAENNFWCCVGTGFENHVKYAEQIYSHNENELYINLYIPSELDWSEKNMKLKQTNNFPDTDNTTITITETVPQTLTFHVRFPNWVQSGYSIKINGTEQVFNSTPGSYVSITREWKTNDKIEINLPKTLTKEQLLGDKYKTAFLNGPIVLAGKTDITQTPPVFIRHENKNISDWMTPGTTPGNFWGKDESNKEVNFLPFYKMHNTRYTVYFDYFTPEEWEKKREEYKKQQEEEMELERLMVDYFRANEQQPEIDHNFKGENVNKGTGISGGKWCSSKGGYFSFEMTVDPDIPVDLSLMYWGNDGGKTNQFDILIDGEIIASESLTARIKPNEFFRIAYPVPFHLTKGKNKVVVKLRAINSNNTAGPIYHAKIFKKKYMAEKTVIIHDYLLPKEPYLIEHNFSFTGNKRTGINMGHPWVDANQTNASISFDMKCSADKANILQLTYWGGEANERKFTILIDNQEIGKQELLQNKPNEIFEVLYPIAKELTMGKSQITVTLKMTQRAAGGLYYAYTFSGGSITDIHTIEKERQVPFSVSNNNSYITITNHSGQDFTGTVTLINTTGVIFYKEKVHIQKNITLKEKVGKGLFFVYLITDNEKKQQCIKIVI